MSDPLKDLLSSIQCGELITSPDSFSTPGTTRPALPICLDSELSVQEGCAALAAHRISSAPIYDQKIGGFVGMLDYRDLVAYVLSVLRKVPKGGMDVDAEMIKRPHHKNHNNNLQEITDIVKRATTDPQGVPIKLIGNLSQLNPLKHVQVTDSVLTAVQIMATSKVHRVVVLQNGQDGDAFVGILSMSSVAGLVASKLGKLARKPGQPRIVSEQGERTLEGLGLVKGDVISVLPEDSVLDALYVMHENSISSVAIVDRSVDDGQGLLGSLSMTDIKEILARRGGWRRLFDTCIKFFGEMRGEQGLLAGGDDRVPSFTVHPSTTLIAAIEKMAATRSHRVWVVEKIGKVVGVVSLSDVMGVLGAQ
ncbi:cell separation during budding [Borealophlyctis nickersoniae]|nr:cell separation during budding [Borealophlyctis nickersoniae]